VAAVLEPSARLGSGVSVSEMPLKPAFSTVRATIIERTRVEQVTIGAVRLGVLEYEFQGHEVNTGKVSQLEV